MNSGVYRLKQDSVVIKDIEFKSGQEIEVVQNVIYVNGHPLPLHFQNLIMNWMDNNPNLFINDTRNY